MLATGTTKSAGRMFLVKDDADPHFLEWQLMCVALENSMSINPSCLQDSCFLVEFFITHTDIRFNEINH